jgi:sulfur-carrier protein
MLDRDALCPAGHAAQPTTTYDRSVVTLRLFATLRDLAGTSRVEMEASSLAEVLEEARRRFGPEFERGLETAAVWVDGEPFVANAARADRDEALHPGAEVALLPPVSGGARSTGASGGTP